MSRATVFIQKRLLKEELFYPCMQDAERGEMMDADERGFLLRAFFSEGSGKVGFQCQLSAIVA